MNKAREPQEVEIVEPEAVRGMKHLRRISAHREVLMPNGTLGGAGVTIEREVRDRLESILLEKARARGGTHIGLRPLQEEWSMGSYSGNQQADVYRPKKRRSGR